MNKKLVVVAFVIIVIAGLFIFWSRRPEKYEGILPCADCAGLKTELALNRDNTYSLKETYLATRDGDKAFSSTGRWRRIMDGKREILQLSYDKPQSLYNFFQKDADHLVVIDRKMHDIDSPMNLTLTRK